MTKDFGEAHYTEVVDGGPGLAAGGDHLGAGDAEELRVGDLGADCCNESGAEKIAGEFACDDADAERLARASGG